MTGASTIATGEGHAAARRSYLADEAFFAGTAAEVTPILSIDRRPVGEGVMGPLTAKVRDAYFRAVRDGSAPHPQWRIAVNG